MRFFVRDLYSITVSPAPRSDPSSSDIDEVLLETNWTNRDGFLSTFPAAVRCSCSQAYYHVKAERSFNSFISRKSSPYEH